MDDKAERHAEARAEARSSMEGEMPPGSAPRAEKPGFCLEGSESGADPGFCVHPDGETTHIHHTHHHTHTHIHKVEGWCQIQCASGEDAALGFCQIQCADGSEEDESRS